MGKMNNNINLVRFQNTKLPKETILKNDKPRPEEVEFVDFANPKAEALGRSQVVTKTDSIDNDIKFMMRNPEDVKKAVSFFDNAYDTLKVGNSEDAYEKAATYTAAFKNEFLAK